MFLFFLEDFLELMENVVMQSKYILWKILNCKAHFLVKEISEQQN